MLSFGRLRAALVSLTAALALGATAAPAAQAVGPTSIEVLSPTAGATVVGTLVLRARVEGPRPDEVHFFLGDPARGWTDRGAEVAPGIWEKVVDLAGFPARKYAAQAWAVTTASGVGTTTLRSDVKAFTVDREFALEWLGTPSTSFSPDGDGAQDELGIVATSDGVGHADHDLWAENSAGTRIRTILPWFSGTEPLGDGATAAVWDGTSDADAVVADGWYCIRLVITASNGRHGSLARPVLVDAAPAEIPVPPQPPGDWCTAPVVPEDPPLVETPYPPLPASTGGDPVPTTPASTTPIGTTPAEATQTETDAKTPNTTQSESVSATPPPAAPAVLTPVLPRTLPPTGPQFATKPLFAAGVAKRSKHGRLTLTVRCVAGCRRGEWIDLELWSVGTAPSRKLAVRVRVGKRGAITISRRVRGTLPRTLELRAPQSGVALPVRVR